MQRKKIMGGAVAAVLVGSVLLATGGGASAARLITGADIKDESVTSKDIKNGTLGLKDMRPAVSNLILNHKGDKGEAGTPGAQGPKGDTGPAGPKGDTGAPGADAFGYVSAGAGYAGLGAHDEWPADDALHETVQKCKAGEVVTGGGFSTWGGAGLSPSKDLGGDANVQITVSAPYIQSDADYVPVSESDSRFAPTLWVVRGYNHGDQPVDVRAWVLCTKAN